VSRLQQGERHREGLHRKN